MYPFGNVFKNFTFTFVVRLKIASNLVLLDTLIQVANEPLTILSVIRTLVRVESREEKIVFKLKTFLVLTLSKFGFQTLESKRKGEREKKVKGERVE